MRRRFSGGKLMPFSERRRSVLLEDVAAVEPTIHLPPVDAIPTATLRLTLTNLPSAGLVSFQV